MKILKKVIISFVAVMMFFVMSPQIVKADDITEITAKVTYHQTEARKMEAALNEFRHSDDAWYWNETNTDIDHRAGLEDIKLECSVLESFVKQRAAEIAVYYSSTRPNGSNFITALTLPESTYSDAYESIAVGCDTAEEVVEYWKESDEKYDGQSNRRNMLSSDHYFGVACAEVDGVKYWVVEFINLEGVSGEVDKASDQEEEVEMYVANSYVRETAISNLPICVKNVGDSVELPKLEFSKFTTKDTYGPSVQVTVKANWISSDPALASVVDGKLISHDQGEVSVYTTAFGKKYEVPVYMGDQKMLRLYNPNSGEHFYTQNVQEADFLKKIGWKDEDIGWIAPAIGNAVYRMYNPNAGDHHYTMNAAERDMLIGAGWDYEGIGWYSDTEESIPLYREYNPNAESGAHNYTTNLKEHEYLVSLGWKDEGIAWYGC